ncbi:protein FAM184A-like [Mya arenaria]|uniref:protein FAM184A-like n=1 Tax=Mya arenaria TaxID=6604 RepID=UPI0022E4EF4F|nr:protein FAM184A-like [Mya arenaria]
MAASAKMSFNYYQNGKYGTLPQNPTKDMEVTQDMHLKMSKKIAQLTKVIYALNTKNDEHEAVVQQIKDQHEEDIQKVLKETKEKVQMLKAKLDADSQNNNKVQQLELALRQNEAIKDQQISQFEHFKRIAEERETKLKSEHAQKMLDFSHDVLKAKKDFEEKLKQFDVWKESVNEDHERKLRDLKSAHEQEIHDIRNLSKDQNNDWLNEVKKVEEKYKDEIEQLHGKYKDLEESKGVMADEYEAKLAKAQLFYEKELEAVMKMNNISQEDANKMLMEEKEKMRKDFAAQESELKKQINSVLGQLTDKEDEVESLKKDLDQLSKNLQDKAGSSSDLLKQLQAANDLASEHLAKLKAAETELSVMKERCSRQENELVKKSSTIGQLEATKLQNESSIQELEGELSKLRDKLAWLEKERHNLERQKSDLSQNQLAQLRSLEKSLEDLSIEKQAMKERYERELDGLRNNANRSQKDLLTQHEAELEKLRQKLLADLATQKLQAEEVLESTKQEMTKLRESEVSLITEDREKLRAEFDRVKSELSSRLKAAEDEVARVNSMLQNKEDGLGSATGMINNLRDANNQLQQQLESSRSDYKAEKTRASNLQAELEKLRLQHEAQLKEAKTEFQQKMDQVTTELDTKWQDTLRRECSKLREEINAQKESEMRAALEQLSRMKDEEISATRAGWEKKVQELMKQIASMKLSIESSSSKSQEELEKLRQESEEERRRLQAELVNAAEEYMTKVKSLEAMHEEDVKRLGEEKARELEELRQQLQSRHIEDMQAQMAAHKATVDSLRDQAEVTRRAELDKQMKELEKDKEEMKERLIEKQVTEIGRLERDHEAHLQAARMELERAVEISKQKERDHALRVEDLQGEITQRERHITNLKEDAGKLQTSISHLNKEIDFKRQEIQKIKADTDHQVRHMEKRMAERLQREVENLQADHIRESQELVRQFNEAQEILKDKISELQILLNEAEDKYNNRESRPEDLELIEQLRYSIREKEEKVRALIEEKKFFQMELVNRETNFNKVFSASPNVGVLNPLDAMKKKGRGKGNNSAPNLSGRLDPLPNSPIHASNLNPSRPLPPFPKKFVK